MLQSPRVSVSKVSGTESGPGQGRGSSHRVPCSPQATAITEWQELEVDAELALVRYRRTRESCLREPHCKSSEAPGVGPLS